MKKVIYFASAFLLAGNLANAKPVTPAIAKTVAENFYKQNTSRALQTSTLVHTALSSKGLPLYYAFNINNQEGFVLVSGDDAVKPIIGYSTENPFVVPEAHTNIGYWLTEFSGNINTLREQGVVADTKITVEWEKYTTFSVTNRNHTNQSTMAATAVAPLVQTQWNQSPYFNALCPGGSVTGCVATTMAQIMRYWSYPAQGTGSSSYCDCTPGYKNNYGTLSANYGTTTYNWSAMPLLVNSSNTQVATLMFQCGVSVDMDYDPSGSAAMVLQSSAGLNKPCAQRAYYTYFGYDQSLIKGLNRYNFADSTWIDTIKYDLNIGRPVQYAGFDATQGGHTWVCDGYDQNNNLHMNWGWGGSDDGYFALNNFLTTNGGFNPSQGHQILLDIVPKAVNVTDAGIINVIAPSGIYCSSSFIPSVTLKNYGSSTLNSCVINYQIDNGAVLTYNWTGSLVNQQFTTVTLPSFTSTAGTHTLTCFTSNPNSTADQNSSNDQSVSNFSVNNGRGTLPVIEGFEGGTSLSAIWSISQTNASGANWLVTSSAAATGVNSCMVDNMNNIAGNSSFLQTSASYDLTQFSSPTLTFKAAYQEKASTNNDKLQVFTSADCGASWTSRKAIFSPALSALSGGPGTAAYVPSASQFTTYSVNIAAVASSNQVMFRWAFIADPNGVGNNVYLDDINIVDALAGINTIETLVNLNVYPNPSANIVHLEFNLSEKHQIAVQVVDVLGRNIENIPSKSYEAGETVLSIGSAKPYPAGIYFVNIDIDNQRVSKKIIIQ